MALDFSAVASQLTHLIPSLRRSVDEKRRQLEQALPLLRGERMGWEALSELLEARRDLLSFTLPAQLIEDPSSHYPSPSRTSDYTVVATDGSQIELDRHAPAPCYVVNLGQVVLSYGSVPRARLSSKAKVSLAGGLDDDPEVMGNEAVREEYDRVLIDLERAVAEAEGLQALAESEVTPEFTLALLDGSLILWTASAGRNQNDTAPYLREYLASLEALRRLALHRPLAVASYISYPGSAEVVNALRVAFCSPDKGYCQANCQERKGRTCEAQVDRLLDRDLFAFLAPGERSAVFASRPRVMERYLPPENRVQFFYLNAGPEIARIEVPAWVAEDRSLLDTTHAAVYDQCQRNFGYPVALMEAHEQAVVSDTDRRTFWQMIYQHLTDAALPTSESAKSASKRLPWS